MPEERGNPGQKQRDGDAQRGGRAAAARDEAQNEERADEKDRQIVGVEGGRSGRREQGESPPALRVLSREQEERQPFCREKRVGSRFRRVRRDERRRRAQGDVAQARSARVQSARSREESERGEKGENSRGRSVGSECVADDDERFLERVEERGTRVESKGSERGGGIESCDPDREQLVVPQRASDEEDSANGRSSENQDRRDDWKGSGGGPTAWIFGRDALC